MKDIKNPTIEVRGEKFKLEESSIWEGEKGNNFKIRSGKEEWSSRK